MESSGAAERKRALDQLAKNHDDPIKSKIDEVLLCMVPAAVVQLICQYGSVSSLAKFLHDPCYCNAAVRVRGNTIGLGLGIDSIPGDQNLRDHYQSKHTHDIVLALYNKTTDHIRVELHTAKNIWDFAMGAELDTRWLMETMDPANILASGEDFGLLDWRARCESEIRALADRLRNTILHGAGLK